jgi:type IV secretory pathway component VirB8
MNNQAEEVSEMLRSKSYFAGARSWYQSIYIAPVGERTFFLIVAALAAAILLAAVLAVSSLTPLVTQPPLFIRSYGEPDQVVPRLIQLKEPGDPINPALEQFFITRYILAREGYTARTYAGNLKFVEKQSDEATYSAHQASYANTNPASFAATLGQTGERLVNVISVSTSKSKDINTAKVQFSAENIGIETAEKSRWTAVIKYKYSDLVIKNEKNPETGRREAVITDPTFQVVGYEVAQNK